MMRHWEPWQVALAGMIAGAALLVAGVLIGWFVVQHSSPVP
jgi:hypothetical protein